MGKVLEFRGDALLADFERPSDAVAATLAFQVDHALHNSRIKDDLQLNVRVGIAMGEVVIADNTITGAGVVLAQRIEQLAKPGGLCITAAIHEALPKRMPFDQEDLGEQAIKGFDEQVHVYRVELISGEAIPPPGQGRDTGLSPKSPRFIITFVAIAFVSASSAYFLLKHADVPEESVSLEHKKQEIPDKPSIAVLPFTNMSSDAEQEYFADGMTEDLITDISKISSLDVIARNSTFTYKGLNPDVRDVGRNLGASHVIEGSVRKAGNTIHITIQLINVLDGKHIWAERYDRNLQDVFAIRDEVIGKIIIALSLKLTPKEKIYIAKRGTENLQAYELFMQGRQQESFFNKEGHIDAQHYYE